MRSGQVLQHDPEARVRTRLYDVEDGSVRVSGDLGEQVFDRRPQREGSRKVIQVLEQDVGPLLRHMAKHRLSAPKWRPGTSGQKGPGGMKFVGRIPNYMLPFLQRTGILHDQQALRAFMDSDEMKAYRTDSAAVSPKGMKRKYGKRPG